jgi:hypothetical protein
VEKTQQPTPAREHELTYEEREAEIERADGEVLLMVETDTEKSGGHGIQYKMASDGKVMTLAFGLTAGPTKFCLLTR